MGRWLCLIYYVMPCPASDPLYITVRSINLLAIVVIRCVKLLLLLFLQAFRSQRTRGVVIPPSLLLSIAAGVIYCSQLRVIARK